LEVYITRLASAQGNADNNRPEIKVFAVSSQNYQFPSWEGFEKVIRDALVDTTVEDATKIIEILREKIEHGKGLNSDARRALGSLRRMMNREQSQAQKPFTLGMHCEAVIAALLDFRRSQSESSTDPKANNLTELSKVLNFVPQCENFHSRLPRTSPKIWFRFQNYVALLAGNFSKFSGWGMQLVAVIPPYLRLFYPRHLTLTFPMRWFPVFGPS
jgi:hypothetical protein